MKCKRLKGTKENLQQINEELGLRGKMEIRSVQEAVEEILQAVRARGDEAVLEYTEKFDHVLLSKEDLRVSSDEINEAQKKISKDLSKTMKRAASNIYSFHKKQLEEGFRMDAGNNSYVGMMIRPLDIAGIYIPGGTAPLPSTVLMDVIPAKAAGVERIVLCTPPGTDGKVQAPILAAAAIAGVDEIYKIGGAQAIAAMAYGTGTVPRVDKICGPGNIYVNTAKRLVFGQVDIDLFAGPSEVLILADETANPEFAAADLLAQSEHDVLASSILVTTSEKIADEVNAELEKQALTLLRKEILEKSIPNFCSIITVPDLDTAVSFVNELAPEHLELCIRDPENLLPRIRHAGAIFLGNYTPEPLGDYFAGPNHTLPTSGTARFFSPLNTSDFCKKISLLSYTKEALKACYKDVSVFARAEGLTGHARSAEIRFEK